MSIQPALIASQIQKTQCQHCSLPIPGDLLAKGELFCCNGCEQVYGILQSAGLGDYYRIRDQAVSIRSPQAAPALSQNYAYLDDPAFTTPDFNCDGSKTLEFYLEGVHCAACVWLIEKLPDLLPDVSSSRLNLGTAMAKITVPALGNFAPVAAAIEQFGYKAYAVKNRREAEAHRQRENQSILMRIGVAAFSAGNLMILSIALYSGLKGALANYFSWLSLLLVLPALSYSAWPFYKAAWYRLKMRRLSIDVPIAFSLLIGFSAGIWQTFQHQETYFDSLAMLVFLLLLSRYALNRIQQQVAATQKLLSFFEQQVVQVWSAEMQTFKPLPVSQLQTGMRISVEPGERLPADGLVLLGESDVDMSLLTGETYPQPVKQGTLVYAGTRNETARLEIEVGATGEQSKMAGILQKTHSNLINRAPIVALTDRLSRRFVLGVLLAAIGIFLWLGFSSTAFARALALIIISCPCALALATPLVMGIAIKRAFARGFLIKTAASLEALPQLKTLIFDKTGTLTEGRFQVLNCEPLSYEAQAAIVALESQSTHPVAQALVRYFAINEALPAVENLEILKTGGIQGLVLGQIWKVIPAEIQSPQQVSSQPMTQLEIYCQNQLQARIWLGDKIRPNSHATLAQLRQKGYDLVLLSGDQPEACRQVAQELGIEKVFSRVMPEQKEEILKGFDAPAMIGDGVNDILALSAARVGISVQGGVEENLQTADIHLTEAGISQLPALIEHAVKTKRLISLCLGFSLIYNAVSITAAILGWVTPLYAAILMPISSLTVVTLAVLGGKKL
jgi:heavy metal translocating P-type ATPase